jgi:hypothetical protein
LVLKKTMTDELPDSGLRRTFTVGGAGREADPDKPKLSAISPYALNDLGLLLRKADIKYADLGGCRNWEKGMPITEYVDSADRHSALFKMRDTQENHAVAAFWNWMCILHHMAVGAIDHSTGQYWTFEELDDRPEWNPESLPLRLPNLPGLPGTERSLSLRKSKGPDLRTADDVSSNGDRPLTTPPCSCGQFGQARILPGWHHNPDCILWVDAPSPHIEPTCGCGKDLHNPPLPNHDPDCAVSITEQFRARKKVTSGP